MRTPRTVVLDVGDVLVPSTGVLPLLAAELDVDLLAVAPAFWHNRTAYDLGAPPDDYWSAVTAAVGRAPEPALLRRLEALDSGKWSALPPASTELVEQLERHSVRLAVLSNAPAPLAAAVRAAAWSASFEHLVFSADVALVKPDPAIYAHADVVLGTTPADVVFFDDRPANVHAARSHGWDAHVWVDAASALEALTY